jgi:hypothetical protein
VYVASSKKVRKLKEVTSTAAEMATNDFDPLCGPADSAYGPVGGLITCYHYLNALGTEMCEGSTIPRQLCSSGGSHVTALSYLTDEDVRSHWYVHMLYFSTPALEITLLS